MQGCVRVRNALKCISETIVTVSMHGFVVDTSGSGGDARA